MSSGLVTIRQYQSLNEANIAASFLQSEGIETFLQDENLVRMNWLLSNAISGVKLQVMASHVEDAKKILALAERSMSDDPRLLAGDVPCPTCDSLDTECVVRGKRPAFLVWLFAGFPLWKMTNRWQCSACGHCWRGSRPAESE